MNKSDLDCVINREGYDSVKLEGMKEIWGREDLLPMWVADMDIKTPAFIIKEINRLIEGGVLGYTREPTAWREAIEKWVWRRHGWKVKKDEISFIPGVVRGLLFVLHAFTKKGDRVLITPPVYPAFQSIVVENQRELVKAPLVYINGGYELDFELIKHKIRGCKLLLLCNPHNPGGVSWSKTDLVQLATICEEEGVLVVSDEIHADLTLPPHKHSTYATVSEEAAQNSITLMSPSKAFNIAGLSTSYSIIQNKRKNKIFTDFLTRNHLNTGHLFAYRSLIAAYQEEGSAWLDNLLLYISQNIAYVSDRLNHECPKITMIYPSASFLLFLDCNALQLSPKELEEFFVRDAGLALNSGISFGEEGKDFMRMNVGMPMQLLKQAIDQLKQAYVKRGF